MPNFPIASSTGDPVFQAQNNSIQSVRGFSRIAADSSVKLNTQERIVSPGDDALSFSTSRQIRTEVSSLKVVQETGQLNITGLGLAIEAIDAIKSQLDDIKKNLIQSQVADSSEQDSIQAQIDLALSQIDSTARNTKLGSRSLLDGSSTIRAFESISNSGDLQDFSLFNNGASLTQNSGVQGVKVDKIGAGGATRLLDDGSSVLSLRVSLLSTNKASKAYLSINDTGGAAGSFVEYRVTGKLGSATLRINSALTATTLAGLGGAAEAFNRLATETGVVLTSSAGGIGLTTVGFGSDEFIKIELIATSSDSGVTIGQVGGVDSLGTAQTEFGQAAVARVNGFEVELGGENGTQARFLQNGYDLTLNFSTDDLVGGSAAGQGTTGGSNIVSTVNIQTNSGVTGVLGTSGGSGDIIQYGFTNFTTESLGRGNAQYTVTRVSGGSDGGSLPDPANPTFFGQQIINQFSVADLGSGGRLALDTGDVQNSLRTIDNAIDQAVAEQTRLGTIQGNFIDAVTRAEIGIGNLTSADADIIGVDAATEITNLVQSQLGINTATSVLSQANGVQQTIFSLLR